MAVDAKHPDYDGFEGTRKLCRDVMGGSRRIKEAGATYLPLLESMKGADAFASYDDYKTRALFAGFTPRTVDGYMGLVFSHDVMLQDYPATSRADELMQRMTMRGRDYHEFFQACMLEELVSGGHAIWVTLPPAGTSQARAYLTLYTPSQVINWDMRWNPLLQSEEFTRVVVKECIFVPKEGDEFKKEKKDQYRHMYLDEDGFLTVEVLRKNERPTPDTADDAWITVSMVQPQFRGQRFDYIPFFYEPPERDPIIAELAETNLHHYRTWADYGNALHKCGIPTPTATGVDNDDKVMLGANTMLFGPEGAKFEYMEYSGQGVKPLAEAIETMVAYMAFLGAAPLEREKAGVEAARSHEIRQKRQEHLVVGRVNNVSRNGSRAIREMLKLSGLGGEQTSIHLNSDLVDQKMSAEDLRELVSAWQLGAISQDSMLWNLKRGERLPTNRTIAQEKEQIEGEGPRQLQLAE
jgi:hypothetical protein